MPKAKAVGDLGELDFNTIGDDIDNYLASDTGGGSGGGEIIPQVPTEGYDPSEGVKALNSDIGDIPEGADPAPYINPNKIGEKTAKSTPVFRARGLNLKNVKTNNRSKIEELAANGQLTVIGDANTDGKRFGAYMGTAKILKGKYYLEPTAAVAFKKWMAELDNNNIPYLVTSALRFGGNTGAGPHGYGIAVDFSNLYSLVGGKTTADINKKARIKYPIFRQIAAVGAKYGWYNPWRLTNGGFDELWHFEYWGPAGDINPQLNVVQQNAQNSSTSAKGVILMTGLTDKGKTHQQQTDIFKAGYNGTVFSYTYGSAGLTKLKEAMTKNPDFAVVLFSKACMHSETIAKKIKTKSNLYMVEPYVVGYKGGTYEKVRAAVNESKVPAINVQTGGGNPGNRGYGVLLKHGGDPYLGIPSKSPEEGSSDLDKHFKALTFMGSKIK